MPQPPARQEQAKQLSAKERLTTLRDALQKNAPNLAKVAGKLLDPARQVALALAVVQRSPTLGECTVRSLVGAVLSATQLGLELDPVLGHAYLVPFRNHGVLEAQMIVGYRGFVALMHRSGRVVSIEADVVYEHDKFKYQLGTAHQLHHVPATGDRGRFVGAWAVVHYRGGGFAMDFVAAEEIDAIKARSPSVRSDGHSPWKTDEDEMRKKTVIRRIAKKTPLSAAQQRAAVLDEYADAGVSVEVYDMGDGAIDVTPSGDGDVEDPNKSRSERLAGELGKKPEQKPDGVQGGGTQGELGGGPREPGAEG